MDSDEDENFLFLNMDEIESKYNRREQTDELNDYEYALKLSEELNGSHSKRINVSNCHILQQTDFDANYEGANINDGDSDYLLALKLSKEDEIHVESMLKVNASSKNVSSYLNETTSVVDPSWETIDPNPDIYALFVAFNQRFFWGRLEMVEVRWSYRMTLCAGICEYQKRAGHCIVKLSKPLLQYRSRKDLVETLLHEMIHAYLFVTKNNRDRDGHGPQFHSHMYRINKESGAHITVYHNFHDEVKLYQNHWWRCDGPCKTRSPFYGYIKRSMNRAPGTYDSWWNDHKASCGGTFHKIKEPENYDKKKSSSKNISFKIDNEIKTPSIKNYFNQRISVSSKESSVSSPCNTVNINSNKSTINSFIKTSPLKENKRIFTLSDLSKNINKQNSHTRSPKKWLPLQTQQNIFNFVNKS